MDPLFLGPGYQVGQRTKGSNMALPLGRSAKAARSIPSDPQNPRGYRSTRPVITLCTVQPDVSAGRFFSQG